MSAARAGLERRYRRLLRLYPREFRARLEAEMLGVLMAGARDGRSRPARGDVLDIVKGALLMRLRGPRGGWAAALAEFALLAPLYLVLTDILQVAFPFRAALLGQPGFLGLLAGPVIVAMAVLAGSRRTALAAVLVAGPLDLACSNSFDASAPQAGTMVLVTMGVFLLEAIALAAVDPSAAHRLVKWWHAVTAALLAGGMQAWSIAYHGGLDPLAGSFDHAALVTGLVFAAIALALPVVFGLGWRVSLLSAAMFYPGAAGLAAITVILDREQTAPVVFALSSMPALMLALYLPPLAVACWGAARALRAARTRSHRQLR